MIQHTIFETAAVFTARNQVLPLGTRGYETDTGRYKDGDNISSWTELGYASGGIISGVRRYVAILTQASTDAPTAVVLENTLGGTVVWTRDSGGVYDGTLVGAFPVAKTFLTLNDHNWDGTPTAGLYRVDDDTVRVAIAGDDLLVEPDSAHVQITVYP